MIISNEDFVEITTALDFAYVYILYVQKHNIKLHREANGTPRVYDAVERARKKLKRQAEQLQDEVLNNPG